VIQRKTVLVLGAGASEPFGFPIGKKLVKMIVEDLTNPEGTETGKILINYGFDSATLKEFATNLHFSQRNSVDAFLEHRPQFLEVGKAAIVTKLISFEKRDVLFQNGNWYRYLFQALNASFESFEKNNLAIITFNYDRSLEFYLLMALKHAYGKSEEECAAKIASIPIIHLHGKMGEMLSINEKFREYSPNVNQDSVKLASSQIKIIHENIDAEPQFVTAHKLIMDAETICFLGFGYDRTNIKRLFPAIQMFFKKRIFGSAYRLTRAEVDSVKRMLGPRDFAEVDYVGYDCLEFLRNYPILFQ
jgi:hypothetical protein